MSIYFTEIFNREKLEHILNHKDYFKTLLTKKVDVNYCPFELCEKYLKSAKGGSNNMVIVNYKKKNNRGRLFAVGAVSLQSMPRAIRGTIADEYYIDIDIENCHPIILQKICKQKKLNILFIPTYINNRDAVINEIIDLNPDLTYSDVKDTLLSLIYGGRNMYDNIKVKNDWIKGYYKETKKILKKVPIWFEKEYELQSTLKGDDYFNLAGSTLSSYICTLENDLLSIMVSYLKENKYINKIAVMCFDGLMIPKSKKVDSETKINKMLKSIEKLIKDAGYDMKLKVKEFNKLDLNIPIEYSREEYICDGLLIDDIDYMGTEYYWYDFMQDMGVEHNSFQDLCAVFRNNINKVMVRCYEMENTIIRKIRKENMFNFDTRGPDDVFNYWDIKEDGTPVLKKISFKHLFLTEGLISLVRCYDKLDFIPFAPDKIKIKSDRVFNTWSGFKAELLPEDEVDVSKIKNILNHIRKVWCKNNETYYSYILTWFKSIFTNPKFKSKIAVVLKSSEKQIGKGIIITEFLIPYVFGKNLSMSIAGLGTVTSKFNEIMMNKIFINCDELSTVQGDYHQSFDILKKRITDNSIKIEIKNGKSFIYPDYSNYIMCTNHDFTIKIELGDARYFILECSPCYKGDFSYFNDLVKEFNQENANHFFSYIFHYDNEGIDVRNIPLTELKKLMIIDSLTAPNKFLLALKDNLDNLTDEEKKEGSLSFMKYKIDIEKCKAKRLYDCYKEWCSQNNEKQLSSTKFGRDIKDHITKNRNKSGIYYEIRSINYSFQ